MKKPPISSTELVDRLRVEQSILLTAGEQHRLGKGIRTGFGLEIEKTLKGLDRVEALLFSLKLPLFADSSCHLFH